MLANERTATSNWPCCCQKRYSSHVAYSLLLVATESIRRVLQQAVFSAKADTYHVATLITEFQYSHITAYYTQRESVLFVSHPVILPQPCRVMHVTSFVLIHIVWLRPVTPPIEPLNT